jgi:hypothetical protein
MPKMSSDGTMSQMIANLVATMVDDNMRTVSAAVTVQTQQTELTRLDVQPIVISGEMERPVVSMTNSLPNAWAMVQWAGPGKQPARTFLPVPIGDFNTTLDTAAVCTTRCDIAVVVVCANASFDIASYDAGFSRFFDPTAPTASYKRAVLYSNGDGALPPTTMTLRNATAVVPGTTVNFDVVIPSMDVDGKVVVTITRIDPDGGAPRPGFEQGPRTIINRRLKVGEPRGLQLRPVTLSPRLLTHLHTHDLCNNGRLLTNTPTSRTSCGELSCVQARFGASRTGDTRLILASAKGISEMPAMVEQAFSYDPFASPKVYASLNMISTPDGLVPPPWGYRYRTSFSTTRPFS